MNPREMAETGGRGRTAQNDPTGLAAAFQRSLRSVLDCRYVEQALAAEPGPPAAGATDRPAAGAATSPGAWILALSGGCDSTALARLVQECPLARFAGTATRGTSDAYGVSSTNASRGICAAPSAIHAVHVHHGLRGAAADADEAACRELAAALGFGYRAVRLSPPVNLPRGAVEKWARSERYRALQDAAFELGGTVVLTGHTRNDQVETLVMRLLHGAGYWGLAGIRPVRRLVWGSPVLLARPLLAFTRADLAAYLDVLKQPYCQDATNSELAFRRNRIRWLLARLGSVHPGSDEIMAAALCELAEAAESLHLAVDRAAGVLLDDRRSAGADRQGAGNRPSQFVIERAVFERVPEALRFGLLRMAAHRLAPSQVPLSRRAFESVARALALAPAPGLPQAWTLGGGVTVRALPDRLLLVGGKAAESGGGAAEIAGGDSARPGADAAQPDLYELDVPGSVVLAGGTRIVARLTADRAAAERHRGEGASGGSTTSGGNREVLDAAKAGAPLLIRYRRPGDRFYPLGAPGRKKLKSFLIDQKVPAAERDRLPLVCSGNDVIWVTGIRIAESARVTPDTDSFLLLERIPPAC